MSRPLKLLLLALGAVAALAVLVTVAAALYLSVNAKARVEAMASAAFGKPVEVRGRVAVAFIPGLHLSLTDVHVRNGATGVASNDEASTDLASTKLASTDLASTDLASADEADLSVELLPLLHHQVRMGSVRLKGFRIAVERDLEGHLNTRRSTPGTGKHRELIVANVSATDATLIYADLKSGGFIEGTACTVEMSPLRLSPQRNTRFLKRVSFDGKVACGKLRTNRVITDDATISIVAKDGVYDFAPFAWRMFGGHGSGTLRADVSEDEPTYRVHYDLKQLRVEQLLASLPKKSEAANDGKAKKDDKAKESDKAKETDNVKVGGSAKESDKPKEDGKLKEGDKAKDAAPGSLATKGITARNFAKGPMDFSADLALHGKGLQALERSMAGEASLRGANLTLEIGDLDKKLSRFEATQSFSLVDVGAMLLAGPIGLGITKGIDYARVMEGAEGSTPVPTLISNWKVEHGVAKAIDVAMATKENRVALQGGLDFGNDRFEDVTLALIDNKGCPQVQQKVTGPFGKPDVEKPNVLVSLAGPARKLIKKAKDLLGGGDKCTPFYTGSVLPPK